MEDREQVEAKLWTEMRSQSRWHASKILNGKLSFRPQLSWFPTYEDLFNGSSSRVTEEGELIGQASDAGRVLISAEAGSGKTWILARLAQKVSETEDIPVWISLRELPGTGVPAGDMESVLRAIVELSHPSLKDVLKSRNWVPRTIVLADGLNEASREYIQPALAALDELARRYPFLCVVVTDRLARRPIALDRWQLSTVLPLPEDEIERVWLASKRENELPTDLEIVSRPFFLDKALDAVQVGISGATTIEHFYKEQLNIRDEALDSLSFAAFRAYRAKSSRVMDLREFYTFTDEKTVGQLVEAGVLRTEGDEAWFTHHLFHDYLAARHLAHNLSEWCIRSFEQVTLGAASFDALRLTVEQIGDTRCADRFIALVYDWNYSAAGYSLVEDRVSSDMICSILAMLAEKRWDCVRSTVEEVSDALRINGSNLARIMLRAQDREELIKISARNQSADPEFSAWRELFSLEDKLPVDLQVVRRISSSESLEGWALANSLRRCSLNQSAIEELADNSRHGTTVVRWRAVHALGMHPSPGSSSALLDRLDDEDVWVRCGAIRSIVEQAAISVPIRASLIKEVIMRVQEEKSTTKCAMC